MPVRIAVLFTLPTECNGRTMRTRDCRELAQASLLTTSPDFLDETELALFDAVSEQIRFHRYGGDCYTYAMLAGG